MPPTLLTISYRPAILYSFSWAQNPSWTTPFPPGPEIVRYLYNVCAKYEILDKIQTDTSIKSIRWLDDDEEWEIILDHLAPGIGDMASHEREAVENEKGIAAAVLRTETIRAKIVVSAVGGLVEPKKPIEFPGMDTFEGEVVHTARWKKDIDLKGKDVVVVGTGCSAGQVVPQLIKPQFGAKSVTQLMRSPPWAVPAFPPDQVHFFRHVLPKISTYVPGFQNFMRKLIFTGVEAEFISLFSPTEGARKRRRAKGEELLAHMHKLVPKEYHEILTPDYEVFCKRRVVDDGWFKSLQAPNVDITTLPLTSVQPRTVTLGPGRYFPPLSKTDSKAPTAEKVIPADVIIMANGFETNEWLHPLDVTGRNGRSLYKTWAERGGAQAYLGTAMDGFPNFFLLFGPNTATGHTSVILASENMVNYSLNFIKPILAGDVTTYEVTESAERAWTADVQAQLKNSVFTSGGCRNWYTSENGWNSTTYPRNQVDFTLRCMFPRWDHWQAQYTRKGLVKLNLGRLLKLFTLVSTASGAYFAIKNGKAKTKEALKEIVLRGREVVTSLVTKLR